MVHDEGVAQRLRAALAHRSIVIEQTMSGDIAIMVAGHMRCGVVGEELMARQDQSNMLRR